MSIRLFLFIFKNVMDLEHNNYEKQIKHDPAKNLYRCNNNTFIFQVKIARFQNYSYHSNKISIDNSIQICQHIYLKILISNFLIHIETQTKHLFNKIQKSILFLKLCISPAIVSPSPTFLSYFPQETSTLSVGLTYHPHNLHNKMMISQSNKKCNRISLADWPTDPQQSSSRQLTPVSQGIFARYGITFKKLLPITLQDFTAIQANLQQNGISAVQKFKEYDDKRVEVVKQLREERLKQQTLNIYESVDDFQNKIKHKNKLHSQSQKLLKQSSKYKKKHSKQRLIKKIKNPCGSIEIDTQQNLETLQGITETPNKTQTIRSFSPKRYQNSYLPARSRELKNKSSQDRKKKRIETSKSMKNLFSTNEQYFQSNRRSSKNIKKISFRASKPQSITLKKSTSSLSNSKKMVRTPHKSTEKLGLNFNFSKTNKSGNKGNRAENQEKDSRLDYYGTQKKRNKTHLKSSIKKIMKDNEFKEYRNNRPTQTFSKPTGEYFDPGRTRYINAELAPSLKIYTSPVIDEYTNTVSKMLKMGEQHEEQLQILQNLSRKSDIIQERQMKRLKKIQEIEKEQIRRKVIDLKKKIERMRQNNLPIMLYST